MEVIQMDGNNEEIPKKSLDISCLWRRHAFYLIAMSLIAWRIPEAAGDKQLLNILREGPPNSLMMSIKESADTYTLVMRTFALLLGFSGVIHICGIVMKNRYCTIPSIFCFFAICAVQVLLLMIIDDPRYIVINVILFLAHVIIIRFSLLCYFNNFQMTFNCPAGVDCFWSYVFVKYVSCLDMFVYFIAANNILLNISKERELRESFGFPMLFIFLYSIVMNSLLSNRHAGYSTRRFLEFLFALSIIVIFCQMIPLATWLRSRNNNFDNLINLTFLSLHILMCIETFPFNSYNKKYEEPKNLTRRDIPVCLLNQANESNVNNYSCTHLEERNFGLLLAIKDWLSGKEFQ